MDKDNNKEQILEKKIEILEERIKKLEKIIEHSNFFMVNDNKNIDENLELNNEIIDFDDISDEVSNHIYNTNMIVDLTEVLQRSGSNVNNEVDISPPKLERQIAFNIAQNY